MIICISRRRLFGGWRWSRRSGERVIGVADTQQSIIEWPAGVFSQTKRDQRKQPPQARTNRISSKYKNHRLPTHIPLRIQTARVEPHRAT